MNSEQHRRNVASLPCAECGLEGYSQCAHANSYEFGKGRGIKSSDLATFPLCASRPGELGCHARHDQYIGLTREEAAERERAYIFSTLLKLAAAGKLKAVK
jgi:hypothetical protein